MNWYSKAALHGDPDAQTQEVIFYRLGVPGPVSNLTQALECLTKSAAKGNSEAMVLLSHMYGFGLVNEDRRRAASLMEKAAALNNPEAQYQLGLLYNKGNGVNRDEEAALKWFTAAAEQGDVLAQDSLADMLLKSSTANRFNQSLKWRQLAAEQGYLPAIQTLRGGYLLGLGVKQDLNKSIASLKQAADEGDLEAKIDLAEMLRFGLFGAEKDSKKALALFIEAANDGSVKAACELGDFYRIGDEDVKKNTEESCKWYKIAAAQGSPEALARVKKYCSGKDTEQKD